jgi:hypothetical protein
MLYKTLVYLRVNDDFHNNWFQGIAELWSPALGVLITGLASGRSENGAVRLNEIIEVFL